MSLKTLRVQSVFLGRSMELDGFWGVLWYSSDSTCTRWGSVRDGVKEYP